MATKTFNSSKSTLLANNGANLGGGQDKHLPVGYYSGYKFRAAIDFTLDWDGVSKIVSAVLSAKTTGQVHVTFGSDPDVYAERINTGEFSPNSAIGTADGGSGWTTAADDYGDIGLNTTNRGQADITTSENTWDTIDITALMEDFAPTTVLKRDGTPGGAYPFYGIMLRPVTESDTAETTEFYSHEAASGNRPHIVLTYTTDPAPSTPTLTAPSGSVTGTPIVQGTFSDPGDTMSKVDIQVSTDSTFASATHWNYSGINFTYNSAAGTWQATYAGTDLSVGTTYYVRARVYDSYSQASGYSSALSFSIAASPTPPLFRAYSPRIELYDIGANRGPGNLVAIIDDAKVIGVSAYANDIGELFFTLPWNHPQISQCVPLQRHYRVLRYDGGTGAYATVARGILEDFEATANEVVFYGSDYMSLLYTTISSSNTSYNNTLLGTIINAQVTAAIAETNSRSAFTSVGTIAATSTTATLLSSYQPRLDFIRSVAEISMSSRSVRSNFYVTRDSPYTWNFTENDGSEELTDLRLEYGGLVNGFAYAPDYANFATHIAAIGIKRDGASILYSTQSSADTSTYGRIARAALFQDVVNQTALDNLTSRAAKTAGIPDKRVSIVLRTNKIAPWGGWDLADNVRVVIRRGSLININGLYTIWGMEWKVNPSGQEDLYLSLSTKLT